MGYYFNTKIKGLGFDAAIERVTAELKKEGFGVLTRIDVDKTLKEKIDADFKRYVILGACNPHFAHKALLAEDKIGVFLPCNVVVEQNEDGSIDVTGVDPIASMTAVRNDTLGGLAFEVQVKIRTVIEALKE